MIWALANWKLLAGAAAVLALVGLIFIVHNKGYNAGVADTQEKYRVEAQEQYARNQAAIAEIDKTHFKELQNAQANIDQLNAAIAAGTRKLYVKAKCKPSATAGSGLDNGGSDAELDGSTAQALIAITSDGDRAIRKLTACQAILMQERKPQ